MKINMIVSVSENWAIGKDNKLLWKLSSDLKNFKEITSGNTVVMGLNTFKSLPNGALPNRKNIVLTDDSSFNLSNVQIAYNIDNVFELVKNDENIFIIGGASIYRQFLEYTDTLYLTVVHTIIDGDTFFPELDLQKWNLVSEKFKSKDNINEYDHTYKIYNKNNNIKKNN